MISFVFFYSNKENITEVHAAMYKMILYFVILESLSMLGSNSKLMFAVHWSNCLYQWLKGIWFMLLNAYSMLLFESSIRES
jgi:hypothetical protein